MSSILMFIRVYRLEIQSVMLDPADNHYLDLAVYHPPILESRDSASPDMGLLHPPQVGALQEALDSPAILSSLIPFRSWHPCSQWPPVVASTKLSTPT